MITVYDVIRRPLVTEKGVTKKDSERTLCFEVNVDANKTQIRQAVEQLFKVKVLAVTRPNRYEDAPGVPTVAEVLPGFNMPVAYFGFLGPVGLPQPVVARLNAEGYSPQDQRSLCLCYGIQLFAFKPGWLDSARRMATLDLIEGYDAMN